MVFPSFHEAEEKLCCKPAAEPRRDGGITGGERSKATIRGNISHAGNGAEICPTENKFVRFQAGTWTICEQQKEPKAATESLAAVQLAWLE